jgi:hypothetical protein
MQDGDQGKGNGDGNAMGQRLTALETKCMHDVDDDF